VTITISELLAKLMRAALPLAAILLWGIFGAAIAVQVVAICGGPVSMTGQIIAWLLGIIAALSAGYLRVRSRT